MCYCQCSYYLFPVVAGDDNLFLAFTYVSASIDGGICMMQVRNNPSAKSKHVRLLNGTQVCDAANKKRMNLE